MAPETPVISVVMPVHRAGANLEEVRKRVHSAASAHELIIVLNDESLAGSVKAGDADERVVMCPRRGRGFAIARGVADARGATVLILHADTLLPPGWDAAINRALSDKRFVGGGFHMKFDRSSPFLDFIIRLSDFLLFLSRAMWGDRAMFARAADLRECLPALDVPLFEDVRLSKALRKRGKLALLDETVVTSAENFRRNGPVTQSLRIFKVRLWYALGGDPQRIDDYYYSR
jgi:glycosyltransferase involved in cell wall biosynthesis